MAGLSNRDIDFTLDGQEFGSGSGLGNGTMPLNPPASEADPADHWKGS